jgi:type IV pilus assembly protein PilA
MEKQPTEKAQEQKPQKPAKKKSILARISFWSCLGGIAYLALALFIIAIFSRRSSGIFVVEFYVVAPFILAEILAFIAGIAYLFLGARMEEQPMVKAPEPKPQKPVKKTASFAKISLWLFIAGIVYFILVVVFAYDFASQRHPFMIEFGVLVEVGAFICAIIGFVQIVSSKFKLTGGGYIVLVIGIQILSADTIPSFIRFPARAKQSEAKQNLGAIFAAYQAYHSDHGTYPSAFSIQVGDMVYNCLSIAGWAPKGTIRYHYNCMNTGVFSPNTYLQDSPCPPGIVTIATKDSFTIAACGNVDNDTTVDVWTIDDAKHLKNVIDDVRR